MRTFTSIRMLPHSARLKKVLQKGSVFYDWEFYDYHPETLYFTGSRMAAANGFNDATERWHNNLCQI